MPSAGRMVCLHNKTKPYKAFYSPFQSMLLNRIWIITILTELGLVWDARSARHVGPERLTSEFGKKAIYQYTLIMNLFHSWMTFVMESQFNLSDTFEMVLETCGYQINFKQ